MYSPPPEAGGYCLPDSRISLRWHSFFTNNSFKQETGTASAHRTGSPKNKSEIMKKFIALALVAFTFAACNDDADTADVTADTTSTTTTTTTTTYTAAEGDVTYRENKVMVYRNGQWVESTEDVKMDNNVVVYRDGRVTRDGKEVRLEDGEVIDRTGNFWGRTGQAIENGWDRTKEGVKDAGKAVGDAAEKVGEKVKNAVDDDKDNN